jgi:serine/threonine-protein kinase
MSVPTTVISKICPKCRVSYPYKEGHVCGVAGPAEGVVEVADGQAQDPLIGAVLGDRYQIEGHLQSGGMGIVYRARHIVLDKPLAVKVMRKAKDEVAQQRFLLEAKSACQINHEHIVDITDYGLLDDGSPYLVMELLQGRPLDALIAKGPLSPRRTCIIGEQIAFGLQVVHDKGILHRDLKPGNVFLLDRRGQDFIKILDFGIAKVTGVSSSAPEGGASTNRPTHEGTVLGTPEYMAPEQALGEEAEPRSDQYSLGCILYEMLTGTPPCTGDKPMVTLIQHINGTIVPLRQRRPDLNIPPSLEAVVMRALSRQREHRFPSMRDLAQALEVEGGLLSQGEHSGLRDASGLWLQAQGGALQQQIQQIQQLAAQMPGQVPGQVPGQMPPRMVPVSSLVETARRPVPAAVLGLKWPPPRSSRVLISGIVSSVLLLGGLLAFWMIQSRREAARARPVPTTATATKPADPPVAAGSGEAAATKPAAVEEPATKPGSEEPASETVRVQFTNTNPVAITVSCPGAKPCTAASQKSCEVRLTAVAGKCEASAPGYKAQTYGVPELRSRVKKGRARQSVSLDARGLGEIKL